MTGPRECCGCREWFNSARALYRHYIDGRCRTADEMTAMGMSQNRHGLWISMPATTYYGAEVDPLADVDRRESDRAGDTGQHFPGPE